MDTDAGSMNVPSEGADTSKEFEVTAGGGGRSPVTQVMDESLCDVTAQGMPFTTTVAEVSPFVAKPVPWMVRTVPPRELPKDGDTADTMGVAAVEYWKGVARARTAVVEAAVAVGDSGDTVTDTGQAPSVHTGNKCPMKWISFTCKRPQSKGSSGRRPPFTTSRHKVAMGKGQYLAAVRAVAVVTEITVCSRGRHVDGRPRLLGTG